MKKNIKISLIVMFCFVLTACGQKEEPKKATGMDWNGGGLLPCARTVPQSCTMADLSQRAPEQAPASSPSPVK